MKIVVTARIDGKEYVGETFEVIQLLPGMVLASNEEQVVHEFFFPEFWIVNFFEELETIRKVKDAQFSLQSQDDFNNMVRYIAYKGIS